MGRGRWKWGGGVRTLSIENLKFNGKIWSYVILANHSFFAHPPGSALAYLPIDTLIQEFIEFICVNIDFIQ